MIDLAYPVVETASDSLSLDPQLPFTGLGVPGGALVMPESVPERVIQTVERLAVDS